MLNRLNRWLEKRGLVWFYRWDNDYSRGWSLRLGHKIRGRCYFEAAMVKHRKDCPGW